MQRLIVARNGDEDSRARARRLAARQGHAQGAAQASLVAALPGIGGEREASR